MTAARRVSVSDPEHGYFFSRDERLNDIIRVYTVYINKATEPGFVLSDITVMFTLPQREHCYQTNEGRRQDGYMHRTQITPCLSPSDGFTNYLCKADGEHLENAKTVYALVSFL